MSSKSRRKKRRVRSDNTEVPMSAMIDIVFLLLIYFILTFKVNKVEAHLAINLPSPSMDKSQQPPQLFEVHIFAGETSQAIDDQGKPMFNNDGAPVMVTKALYRLQGVQPVTLEELEPYLQEQRSLNPLPGNFDTMDNEQRADWIAKDITIMIKVDQGAHEGHLVTLLDRCRKFKLMNLNVQTLK